MTLAQAISRAAALDLRPLQDQEALTRQRLLPAIDAIVARLKIQRAAVDDAFLQKRAGLTATPELMRGEASLAGYPIGFCGPIRDQVHARLVQDREFRELIGPGTVFKKIFVLLQGTYFQNALQLGNLYIDVANDTVFLEKPKIEWARIEDVRFENAENWTSVAAVARKYHHAELYPNLLFPLAFPVAPFFAIRASGRIDLFHAQDLLFYKDLGDGLRRARALLADKKLMERRLPDAYEKLLREACGGNLHAAFPLAYAPSTPETVRTDTLPEFATLGRRPDEAALATVRQYLRLVEEATRRLARMNLTPPPEALVELRASGAVPSTVV